MKQLTREEAKAIYESKEWESWTLEKVARFQLFQDRLCMPFSLFHKAMEVVLERSIWTHEFADAGRLQGEYIGENEAPTFEEIIEMIPEEKRIVIGF